ncbi:hypothetical protein BGW36DRAFT_330543 [Talaromyces proteolyticus]|uniref:Zn(2)-C6 fungal-type domain-containing protein n=1 Tax=Talaromyces proteolyticus TaxID=1131652 RepID=A0AAD4KJ42_9EURO|nr:uncharacterized protein BGW36DRAFT_330543 [Talaromyces proteolyticus]KAH8689660.1 hypothetical protein BGW36DRAFT_330543 [Talaromyces proteolyticus]
MASALRREYKRVYQACEPCREKKVRCESDPVDKLSCARCQRESRKCYFAATRVRNPAKSRETNRVCRQVSSAVASSSQSVFPSISSSNPRISNTEPADREQSQQQNYSLPDNGRAATVLLQGHPRTYHDALTVLSVACANDEQRRLDSSLLTDVNYSQPLQRNTNITSTNPISNSTSPGTREALRAWSGLRFVCGGLFTPEEALDMVDHFYKYHAPLTAVVPDCFRNHAEHPTLIEEEPILTITLLMIGSRYRRWTGPGALSRSFLVHDRLWRYLQGMITRLFWSEDILVGELTSVMDPVDDSRGSSLPCPNPRSNGFRTIGTCEALLLLLDWHPQGLHFPSPYEDTASSIVWEPKSRCRVAESHWQRGPGSGHNWLARSDRLCRSMLSTVSMLATEMGVFDEEDGTRPGAQGVRIDQQRFYRVRYLIWVYATQQPGRPGWRILTPAPSRLCPPVNDDTIRCWVGVATIMRHANELLFPSQKHTNEIIRNGEYVKCLQTLQPLLQNSLSEFDSSKLTRQMRSILSFEYAHVQLCIFSVALQAVIDRRYHYNEAAGEPYPTPPRVSKQEEGHLIATVKGAQIILRTVIDDFVSDGTLRYLPVRSFSRVLGAALFLLKCCAARIREVDRSVALSLIKHLVSGLRSVYVDDTHLCPRWGDLLERLSRRIEPHTIQTDTATTKNYMHGATLMPSDNTMSIDPSSNTHVSGSTVLDLPQNMPTEVEETRVRQPQEFENSDNPQVFSPWTSNVDTEGYSFEAFSMWWDCWLPQSMAVNYMSSHQSMWEADGNDPMFRDGVYGEAGLGAPLGSSGYSY